MPTPYYDIVRHVIRSTAQTIAFDAGMANERYLHHSVSSELQKLGLRLDLADFLRSTLHPEWATWKNRTGVAYARYRNSDKKLWPADGDGSEGHLDFALGSYDRPALGIELLLSDGWPHEDFVGDCVKVFDIRTPFSAAVSFTVIMRPNGLPRQGKERRLENRINSAVHEALRRLNGRVATARDHSHCHYRGRLRWRPVP